MGRRRHRQRGPRHYCPSCEEDEYCDYRFFFSDCDGITDPRSFFNPKYIRRDYYGIPQLGLNVDKEHFMAIRNLFPPCSVSEHTPPFSIVPKMVMLTFEEGWECWELPAFFETVGKNTPVPSFWEPFLPAPPPPPKPAFQEPRYKDFWEYGSHAVVPIDQYRELRSEGNLPAGEKVLLFREPSALFFRPPIKQAPALSISTVQTVFSVAPSSVGASPDNDSDNYIAVPKKAIRAAKQQLRAAREALKELDPFVRATEIKTKTVDGFKTPIKSASQPPSPQTAEHTCRKCEASFRSRNALFDHIYSNTCKPSSQKPTLATPSAKSTQKPRLATPSSKSSNLQSSIITSNDTLVNQTAPKTPVRAVSSSPGRLASSTATVSPPSPRASDSHGLFTPVKNRPISVLPQRGSESPIEWEFKHTLPAPFASTTVTPLSPRSRRVTTAVKHKESSQLFTPDGSHGNRASTPSSPCSCRTCNKSFASRNLLFAHLHEHNHCRPDKLGKKTLPNGHSKSLKIKNTSWHSGKVIQIDFGVLGDVISKLTAVASAA